MNKSFSIILIINMKYLAFMMSRMTHRIIFVKLNINFSAEPFRSLLEQYIRSLHHLGSSILNCVVDSADKTQVLYHLNSKNVEFFLFKKQEHKLSKSLKKEQKQYILRRKYKFSWEIYSR